MPLVPNEDITVGPSGAGPVNDPTRVEAWRSAFGGDPPTGPAVQSVTRTEAFRSGFGGDISLSPGELDRDTTRVQAFNENLRGGEASIELASDVAGGIERLAQPVIGPPGILERFLRRIGIERAAVGVIVLAGLVAGSFVLNSVSNLFQ